MDGPVEAKVPRDVHGREDQTHCYGELAAVRMKDHSWLSAAMSFACGDFSLAGKLIGAMVETKNLTNVCGSVARPWCQQYGTDEFLLMEPVAPFS